MNHIYRLVFNRALGVMQVASELVTSSHGDNASSGGAVMGAVPSLRFALWCALGFVGILAPVSAQQADGRITADPNAPGRQRPVILAAPNGVPVVNIATASAGGVSRNSYSQLDVGASGAILNNSRTNVQTQLGGWVQGNPSLATGTAKVILNEVNGPASQIHGFVEVGGDRAAVVIANPAGIQISGGFINASRVTLTTGTPVFNGGSLDGYRVEGGAITVDAAGLDTRGADYTDLIARSLQVNGGIWAQQLQATLGVNTVSVDHAKVKVNAANGAGPAFALDVAALGGMYANKVFLVGNEHGVGMRNAGTIGAQAGELVVTVDGLLENSDTLQSKTDTRISASAGVANAGTISAARELIVTTPGDVDNSAGTLNAQRIEVEAQRLRNHGGAIEQTGIQTLALNAGTLSNRGGGRIGMAETSSVPGEGNGGSTPTPGTGPIGPGSGGEGGGADGTVPPPAMPVFPLADGALNIAGTLDNDGGQINSGGGFDLTTTVGLNNDGGHLGLRKLAVSDGDVSNAGGELTIAGSATLHVNQVNNDAGSLAVAGALDLSAQHLTNRGGTLNHSGTDATHLQVAGTLDNTGGTLASNASALVLGSSVLVNERGRIEHAGMGGLSMTVGTLHGASGAISTAGAATVRAGIADHRSASLTATRIELEAEQFDNRSGNVIATGAEANTLTVHGRIDNGQLGDAGGSIASNGDLHIIAGTLGNAGGTVQQAGVGELAIDVTALDGAGGSLASNGSLTLTGHTADLRGGTTTAQRIAVDAGALTTADGKLTATGTDALDLHVRNMLDNTGGTLVSNGAVQLNAGGLTNANGTITAAGTAPTQLAVASTLDNTSGMIASAGAMAVQAQELVNQGGKLQAANAMQVTADGRLDNSANGVIASEGDLSLTATTLANTASTISHAGDGALTIEAAMLDGSRGTIASNGALVLSGGTVNLRDGKTFARRIAVDASILTTAGGKLTAIGTDALDLRVLDALDNTSGTIASNGAVQLNAGALTNASGTITAAGAAPTRLAVAGTLDNTSGIVTSAGTMTVQAHDLVNRDGIVQAAGASPLQVRVDGRLDNSAQGTIASGGDLSLIASTFDNTIGTISHAGDGALTIDAFTLDGASGTIASNGALILTGGTVNLRDGQTFAKRIAVGAGDVTTAGGAMTATGTDALDLRVRGAFDNTNGAIASNGAVRLNAGALTNASGTITAAGTAPTQLAVTGALDNSSGTIALAGAMTVQARDLANQGGTVQAAHALQVTVAGLLDNSADGVIASEGDLSLAATALDNTAGTISHAGEGALTIATTSLDGSRGTIASNGALTLTGETLNLRASETFAKRIAVDAGSLATAGGAMTATGADALDVRVRDALDNTGGTISGNGALKVSAQTLTNRDGELIGAGAAPSTVQVSGSFDNTGGTLAAAGDATVHAGALINAGGAVQAAGTSALTLRVNGHLDNSAEGVVAAGGAGIVTAASLDNRRGTFSGGEMLGVTVTQALDNSAGLVISKGDLSIRADSVANRDKGALASIDGDLDLATTTVTDNSGGAIQAAGDVAVINSGLGNAGGLIVGANTRIDTRRQALDNAAGTIAANVGALEVRSGALNNDAGLLQSPGAMSVDTNGQALANTNAGDTGGIASGGTMTLDTGDVDNHAGLVHATGDLIARVGTLENGDGQFGGSSNVLLDGAAVRNTGGIVQAGPSLVLVVSGTADNTAGLMVADGKLAVTANAIDNRNTLNTAPDILLGLQGGAVMLAASQLDNRTGLIAADTHVGFAGTGVGNGLDNTSGTVSSAGSLAVTTDSVTNTDGTLLSGTNQAVTANTLTGDGRVLSQGDLTIALQGNYSHTGEITANGKADIGTVGTLVNRATIQAGDLTVRAGNVDNTASGTISGGRTHVIAGDLLTNRGLIDGSDTRIDASHVTNSGAGRVYGDHIAIQARSLTNREETVGGTTTAATIASRGDLDIGVTELVNREHASLIAMGDARIGGTLDADGVATGLAQRVTNNSATIEVAGDLVLATVGFHNLNAHYTDTVVSGASESLVDIFINDHTDNSEVPREMFGRTFSMDDFEMVYEGGWRNAGFLRGRPGTEMAGVRVFAWTETRYQRNTEQTQVVSSDPGKVKVGGNLYLDGGEFVNDKSQILVGGAITGAIGSLRNIEAEGRRTVTDAGAKRFTYDLGPGSNKRRIWENQGPYQQQTSSTITLPVAELKQNTAIAIDGFDTARSTGAVGGVAGGAGEGASDPGARQITEVTATLDGVNGPGTAAGHEVDAAAGPDGVGGRDVTATAGPDNVDSQQVAASSGPDAVQANGATAAIGSAPAVIRTIGADTQWPDSSLFRIGPSAGGYLIETDPQFASYRNWLSSDYLLDALGLDAANIHKRLGDGFYEQKLVREQIGQLTGRRFLDGYASDEAQYRALLTNGATFAKAWGLRPGIALTAAQMAELTSDIVWLVEQTVTLPDGKKTTALVPQVYVRVKPGDLDGNGTLIAADTINLDLKGDLVNSGTIAGRTAVQLKGENLRNLGGRITGNAVALHARTDLDNIGGVIDANQTLIASAGRDVNVASTTNAWSTQIGTNSYSNTTVDRVAGLYVTNPGGTLLVAAGRDANLTAVQVVNAGAGGQTAVVAGRNVNLNTVTVGRQDNSVGDADNFLRHGYTQEVGTTIHTTGNVLLQADGDINARAATVTSGQGAVTAVAEGNVNITNGVATANHSESHKSTSNHTLGSSTTLQRSSVDETFVQGSTFSGKTVGIQGQNITVTGSNVVSDAGTTLIAKNNLTVEAAHDTRSESRYHQKDESGVFSDGGASITAGKRSQTTESNEVSTYAVGSMVGSLGGDTTLVAKEGVLHVQGSTVSSPEGNVTLLGKAVNIEEAYNTSTYQEKTRFKQSGVTLSASAPVVDAAVAAGSSARTMGDSKDSRVNAMAAANTAYDAYQAGSAVAGAMQGGTQSASISLTYGEQQSQSETNASSREAVGSSINGKNVAIVATGAGYASTIRISGSDVYGGDSATLYADGNIDVLAAQNTYEQRSENSSSGWNAGVAASYGSGGGAMGITAGGNAGKGNSEGKTVTHTNSHVGSGGTTSVTSGGTLTLKGGQISGQQVAVDVKNLSIESLQDTQTYDSRQQNAEVQVTVGYGASVSGSYNQSKINSDYASVNEQSGILAGDGGYSVKVKERTDLKGGIITSTDAAEAAGKNNFSTGTLTISDIKNHADYEGSSFGISGQAGVNGSGEQGKYQMAQGSSDGKAGGMAVNKSVGSGRDDDHQSSTTHSGINTSNVTITDATGQAATGKTIDQIKTGVATATSADTVAANSGALVNRFDAAQVQKELDVQVQVTQMFDNTQQGVRGEINASIDEARQRKEDAAKKLKEHPNMPKEQAAAFVATAVDAQKDIERLQKVGVLVSAIASGLSSPADGASGIATATLAPGASYLIGQHFKKNAAKNVVDNGDRAEEGGATHLLTHALLGAAVAGSGGDGALLGALAAGGAEAAAPALAKYMFGKDSKDLTADEKETIGAIVGVGGTVLGSLASEVATLINASSAAQNAVNNNWEEIGHFSTMATVLFLAGFSEQDAKAIALAAWSPDTDDRNAATSKNRDGDNAKSPGSAQQEIHLLDGESDPVKVVAKQQEMGGAVASILAKIKQYENDPAAKARILSDPTIQRYLHAFGDSYAHVDGDGTHYPPGRGHAVDNVMQNSPDKPDRNSDAYKSYVLAIYDIASKVSNRPERMNREEVSSLATKVTRTSSEIGQRGILFDAVKLKGGRDASGAVNSPVPECDGLKGRCSGKGPGSAVNPVIENIYRPKTPPHGGGSK